MTSAPPRSTTTSSHRLPTSPKAHNRTLPAVCSGAFCASLVLEPYLSQGLPHPSPLRGELLKLWCSQGALLHPQGDPGDHNCMFHHTYWYDHIFIIKTLGKSSESFSAKNTSHKVLILIVLLQMQQHMSKRNHDVLILIMTITGDHRQAEGRRRCGRDRERLEVRGHGARQALPHHLHRLHRHRHRRRPRCCAACHCHVYINS